MLTTKKRSNNIKKKPDYMNPAVFSQKMKSRRRVANKQRAIITDGYSQYGERSTNYNPTKKYASKKNVKRISDRQKNLYRYAESLRV